MQDLEKIALAQLHSEGRDVFDVLEQLETLKDHHAKLVELAEQLRQCAFSVCEEHAVGEVSNIAITQLREAEEALKEYDLDK